MKKILTLALLGALALGAVSCGGGDDGGDNKPQYTVTFNADGGTPAPASQKVKEGDTATAPPTVTRAGYVFMFWSQNGSTAYNFSTPVTASFTLTARWQDEATVEYWQVAWELNDGAWPAGDNHATKVVRGGTLAEPAEPTKTGSTFEGWYKEAALTNRVSFPYDVSAITADFTLYAKWTTGNSGGGGEPDEPGVYVAGYVQKSGKNVATVWKDGEVLYSLTDGTKNGRANEVFVAGRDVYAAGEEEDANAKYIAKVWKNGEELYSFPAAEPYRAISIYVSGGDVYAAGFSTPPIGDARTSKVWKNGEELYTLTEDGSVNKIRISGGDVYVSGTLDSGDGSAAVWKNGNLYWYSDHYSRGSNGDYMYISDNGKIYVSLGPGGMPPCVMEVRDQGDIHLYEYDGYYSASVNSFAVSDGDVYAAVNIRSQTYNYNTSFFKNETRSFSISGTHYMYLSGEDIYSAGSDGTVRKNGEELYSLSEGSGEAAAIIVVN